MSTKTTFKRIALVAVAALGFGMLSVVPSSAAARTATSVVVGDIPSARVGVTAVVPVKVYLPAGSVLNDTLTVNAEITAAPIMGGAANAASAMNAAATAANDGGALLCLTDVSTSCADIAGTSTEDSGRVHTATRATGVADYATSTNAYAGVAASTTGSYAIVAADVTAGYVSFNIRITPDVAGSYTVLVSSNSGVVETYTAGDPSATFTISTGGVPTGITITNEDASSLVTSMDKGIAVAISLVGGTLSGIETINLSTGGTISKGASAGALTPDSTYAATVALTKDDFINGTKIVWLKDAAATAARTISLTATGAAGIPSSVTATKTYSTTVGLGAAATTLLTLQSPNVANTATTFYAMTNAVEGTETSHTSTYTVTRNSTSQKIGYTVPTGMIESYGYITLTDSAGTITGVGGLVTDRPTSAGVTTAASGSAFSFAASGVGTPNGTELFRVVIPVASATNLGVVTNAKTRIFVTGDQTNSTFTVSPSSTILAAPAAAVALTATLKDQFGAALSNVVVTITTSGRNNPAATTATTDSAGKVTFTTADASISTTALTDTVTFSATSATSSAVTINYANTAVGTLTATGGNTAASVNALTNTVNGISVGSSTTGAEAGAITITATVKDALGNAMAGVPVSFTVAGTTVAFTSTSATKYSGSTGTATGSLYAWANGTYTYTVTAGGKTTTGTATFGSITPGNARVISATVSGNVVTGKAVDRYGNPVQNAVLYASTSGSANIGGLLITAGATTLADGTTSWVVTGSGDVTVSAVNPTSIAGTTAYETAHLAGNATLASATVAAKAYAAATVGTATTAETSVGATFAPAGVASAKVTVAADTATADAAQAAADAAAEATDAANAATDAANAAAEAADAATAAAQDAADAVAALATSVEAMIGDLKKQITALTNLIIKIQKKVKA